MQGQGKGDGSGPGARFESSPLPAGVRRGLDMINEGHFHEAHEVIEEVWAPLPKGPQRTFYQGLIQWAVAMHHHRRGRSGSALTMIERARTKLVEHAPRRQGVDVAGLLRGLERLERAILEPDEGSEFVYPRVAYEL